MIIIANQPKISRGPDALKETRFEPKSPNQVPGECGAEAQASREPIDSFEVGYQNWRKLDGPLLRWTSDAVDLAWNLIPSLDTGLTTASAGAARGVVYGANLSPGQEKVIMGANLAAIGAAVVMIPQDSENLVSALASPSPIVGALTQVQRGFHSWSRLPEGLKNEVHSSTERAMDHIFSGPKAESWQQRALQGLAGEVVGFTTGGLEGIKHTLNTSERIGQGMVDAVQRQIYKNMHQAPSWQLSGSYSAP